MTHAPINFADKLSRFNDHWAPKIIAQMNDYHFKLVKLQGDFVWHAHDDTDEVFVVLDGALTIHLRDGEVTLRAGEMFIVPRGVEHKPFAKDECHMMLVEPAGTLNTGGTRTERTAQDGVWI